MSVCLDNVSAIHAYAEAMGEVFLESRHEEIEPLWMRYCAGEYTSIVEYFDTTIDLIPADDLIVRRVEDEETGDTLGVEVIMESSPLNLNFMGHDPLQRCYAFRGEARLLELFLSYTAGLLQARSIRPIFSVAEVRVASGGLPANLTYEQFAGHVEVIQVGLWLPTPANDLGPDEDEEAVSIVFDEQEREQDVSDLDIEAQIMEEVEEARSPADVAPAADSPAPAETNCTPPSAVPTVQDVALDLENSGRRYPRRNPRRTKSLGAEAPKPVAKKASRARVAKTPSPTKARRRR